MYNRQNGGETGVAFGSISFDIHITTISYIMSILMTFAFALIVNIVMYFKLDRINMAESLKSIE